MPFQAPQSQKDDLATGSTKLGVALRIERLDGQIFGFTNIRRTVSLPEFTVRGVTVPAWPYIGGVFSPSNLVQSDSPDKVDNWEASFITGDHLREVDIENGLFADAAYTLLIFDWKTGTPFQLRARGWVGAPRLDGDHAIFKMRSLAQAFSGQILAVTSPLSRATWADLESGRCGFAFNPATGGLADGHAAQIAGGVNSVDAAWPRRRFNFSASTAHPERRFLDGRVRFTSGPNAGFMAGVLSWDKPSGLFTLDRDAPQPISAGDGLTARAHIPTNIEDWRVYFGSGYGFMGEPDITTQEKAQEVKQDDK